MRPILLKLARAGKAIHVLCASLGVLLFSLSLFSQGNLGRILGTVTDQTGGVVSGATVTIIDKDRGVARTLTTDDAGEYNAPSLIPGTYIVRAEAKGFKRLERQNVVLEVGKEIRVDLTVQPGEQIQTVTVTEAIPLVETTNATLGGTLNNADISDIPLNGRNYQNLLSLRPGVMIQPGGSPWTQSSNNTRPDETVWMVDGVFNANFADRRPIVNTPSPFTDGATILPVDAIQEFNLEEDPKAEYGFSPGAVVNVGIKSGTNTLHGSAYAFGRDGSWDARNVFNSAPAPELPTNLKQFGGVLGGPIKKDKLFFFGGYEGLRSFVGNALGTQVPATGPGLGPGSSMLDAIAALQKAKVARSTVSEQLLGCTGDSPSNVTGAVIPVACTGGLIQGAAANTTTYNSGFPNTNQSDNGVGKIDYRINDKHTIHGTVVIGRYFGLGEDHPIVSALWRNPDPLKSYTVTGDWIWTASSSLVNEVRFGFNRFDFALLQQDNNLFANGKDYPLNTGITSTGGFPNVEIGSNFAPLGGWRGRPIDFENPSYDFQDNLSYLKGKHSFKFGGEFTHILVDFNLHDTRGRIQFRGKQVPGLADCFGGTASCPLEDFFAGKPQRAFQLIGTTPRHINWMNYAGFVQDDWRIKQRLMLNLGLRYSYVSPLKEANDFFGTFDPTQGLVQQGQSSVGGTVVKPDYKDFSPRLGFAWDVTGKGTTTIRGGASLIYSMFSTAQFMQSGQQNFGGGGGLHVIPTGACRTAVTIGTPCPQTFGGTIVLGNATIPKGNLNWDPTVNANPGLNGGVVFPTGATLACGGGAPPCNIITVDPNLKTPYVVNWDLGVQHAFTNNLSLEVGYVATHGARLTNFIDINQANPVTGALPFATRLDASGAPMSYLGFINRTVNDGRSNYNSLQTTLTKRISHGLNFTAGYTYGHGLDNGSLSRFGNLPQDSLNPGAEYGSSDYDVRHRFTLTAGYEIPGKNGFAQLLKGWKLNAAMNIESGQPWLVDDTNNNFIGTNESTDRWDFFGNPNDFKSGSSSLPYCTGPGGTGSSTGCTITSGISGQLSCAPGSDVQGLGCTTVSSSLASASSMWSQCTAHANPAAIADGNLASGGCFVVGNSVMTPPAQNTFGNMGRNIFRDSGFKNVDLSVFKEFKFTERYAAEFRWELFNVFNHPNIANPYGAANGWGGGQDPSAPGSFGCGCATPDVAAGNPLVGSGSARVMQLGLKLTF
jgi:carboxypeptidase family protein/TonB-dependent receptor-like protein